VGKLTVATELHALTGFRLFHNHLTVDAIKAVFEFASPPFQEVIHRLRLDVFETAMRNPTDLIFTNNSVWGIPNGRALFVAFAEEARRRVVAAGGDAVFVQLTAPLAVLEERVGADSRKARQKLTNPARLREILAELVADPLHSDDLVIDTSALDPHAAAEQIAERTARVQASESSKNA